VRGKVKLLLRLGACRGEGVIVIETKEGVETYQLAQRGYGRFSPTTTTTTFISA